jgi:hypothetical protein
MLGNAGALGLHIKKFCGQTPKQTQQNDEKINKGI